MRGFIRNKRGGASVALHEGVMNTEDESHPVTDSSDGFG